MRHKHAHLRRSRRPAYGPRRPKHNVPVNIVEHSDRFEAHVYCTGFSREGIRINLAENVIYISGRRTPEVEFPNFLLQEFPIKSFERAFELSEAVDQESVTARMQDGVLIIDAPKKSSARAPEREVSVD